MTAAHQTGANREASLRRVAIVLSSLPSSVALGLLNSFDDAMKQSLRRTMTSLADVDPLERQRALQAFKGSLESQQDQATRSHSDDGDEVMLRGRGDTNPTLSSAVMKRELGNDPNLESNSNTALSFLGDAEDDVLVGVLDGEHPQAVALVLASISPAQAARILPQLDASVQKDALSRIGRLNDVPEEAVQELASHLRNRVQQSLRSQRKPGSQSTGQRALNAILAAMPSPKQASPTTPHAPLATSPAEPFVHSSNARVTSASAGVNRIAEHQAQTESATVHPDRFERSEIHSLRIAPESTTAESSSTETVHQQLISLAPHDLCQALGQVETRQAMLTLCGLPKHVAEAALRVLPRAYAKQVRHQMSRIQSLELREIDEAKSAVAAVSLKLNGSAAASSAKTTTLAA
ncbi:Flagellar motor switch protein FliG [Novipirellula galeiformis]|uniref:Flagellar motor switch protein FliG n=1 Tax=Novipirellula galeiformis TaxID=2528004 RepID=A0A5C6CNX6_9BACT|nr:FliG C-terminal domain-containing protein [Novipirellula galeiformis]TWU26673.1 Flagellar motor switch protein FliG [Novipirellula galeiformis]